MVATLPGAAYAQTHSPAGVFPVGRAGRLESTEPSEKEKSGTDGRDAGAAGCVCAGDSKPFAAPFPGVWQPESSRTRAAGVGAGADTSRGGGRAGRPPGNGGGQPGTRARGEGWLGQAGNFHPPGIN